MLEQVKALTEEYDMLPSGVLVLCAVSGGADSMCLLHLLQQRAQSGGFRIAAAHYNHGLRGEESERDAEFVRTWCAEQGIPCVLGYGDVAGEATQSGLGVEEAARNLRYAFLRHAAKELGAGRIATAHNADDNVETLLLRLCRGTGLHGLAGIPPRRDDIVRPLLTSTRAEILNYLKEYNIPHVEDSSNSDEAYSRNKIRAKVLPVLRELNPRLSESVSELTGYLRADNDYLNAAAAQACLHARWAGDDLVIEAQHIAALPTAIAPRAVRRLLEQMGDGKTNCAAAHINAVVALARGEDPSAVVFLPDGLLAQRVYKELLLTTQGDALPPFAPVPLQLDGETEVGDTGWIVHCAPVCCPAESEASPGYCYLAAEQLEGPLMLRPRAKGDELLLPKRGGTKTIKKLLIEEKVPRRNRERIPVLVDEKGVVAVAGFGPDQSRLAQPGQTAYALLFYQKEGERWSVC